MGTEQSSSRQVSVLFSLEILVGCDGPADTISCITPATSGHHTAIASSQITSVFPPIPPFGCPTHPSVLQAAGERVKVLKRELKAAQGLIMRDELKGRQRVLRRLGYMDSEGVVTLKGRVACEIQTGDELVISEMIFNGVFKVTNTALGGDVTPSVMSVKGECNMLCDECQGGKKQ